MWSKFQDDWLVLHQRRFLISALRSRGVFPAASSLLSLSVQFTMSFSVLCCVCTYREVREGEGGEGTPSLSCSKSVSVAGHMLEVVVDQLLSVCNTLDSSSSFLTRPSAGKKSESNTLCSHSAHTWLPGPNINLTLRIISIKLRQSTLDTASITTQFFPRYKNCQN